MENHLRNLQMTDTKALDIGWTLIAGFLVFLMQAGFSLVEAGYCRYKNTQSIVMKNVLDASLGAIGWFLIGWGVAFGEDNWSAAHGGGFIGTNGFWATNNKLTIKDSNGVVTDIRHDDFFFQWTFCATAATIVSGALAERACLEGYTIFAFINSVFVYPVVVHWTWGGGWLAKKGFLDFAGSGIVHMLGGFTALIGSRICGPRLGRFDGDKEFGATSILNVSLGTFLLWFGWFGFNAGSTVALSDGNALTAALCCVTTTISAAFGGVTCFAIASWRQGKYDVTAFANGILGGLVAITAGCANVEIAIAALIGIISGFVLEGAAFVQHKAKIDDPVDAFPVHGANGLWGVVAAGLFDKNLGFISGEDDDADFHSALGPNLVGICAILGWVVCTTTPLFLTLRFFNLLRVSQEHEEEGLDSEFVSVNGEEHRLGQEVKKIDAELGTLKCETEKLSRAGSFAKLEDAVSGTGSNSNKAKVAPMEEPKAPGQVA